MRYLLDNFGDAKTRIWSTQLEGFLPKQDGVFWSTEAKFRRAQSYSYSYKFAIEKNKKNKKHKNLHKKQYIIGHVKYNYIYMRVCNIYIIIIIIIITILITIIIIIITIIIAL